MTWTPPSSAALMETVNATWPAAQEIPCGPFLLRDGRKGGKRASAATLEQPSFTAEDISFAETEMVKLDQPVLFAIRDGEETFDKALEQLGYRAFDFVILFAGPATLLAEKTAPGLHAIGGPEPLAAMEEIWAEGGIGPARVDVMRRVTGPKSYLLGRVENAPSGAGFVAIDGGIGMIHALEILPSARRKGLGFQMTAAAAEWVASQGAKTFALVVLSDNKPACELYKRLGMVEAGKYHYRIKEKHE